MQILYTILLFISSKCLFLAEYPPDFKLLDQNGNEVVFSSLTTSSNKGPIITCFLPNEDGKNSLKELRSIEKYENNFTSCEAKILIITTATPEENKKILTENNLSFTMLSDSDKEVIKTWEVPHSLLKKPRRISYVFTPDGYLSYFYRSSKSPRLHGIRVLKHAKLLYHPENPENNNFSEDSAPLLETYSEEDEIIRKILLNID